MIIRVFEAFAGYGSQMMALRRVARRHVPISHPLKRAKNRKEASDEIQD